MSSPTSDDVFERLARPHPPPRALRWAAASFGRGAKVASVRRLRGGISTAVHALDIVDRRGMRHAAVLRRFVRPNWKAPRLPRREAVVLELLEHAGYPAPRLIAVDAEARHCDQPALLMTRLPVRVDLVPNDMTSWLRQIAAALPPIHAIAPSKAVRPYRPYYNPKALDVPAWSRKPRAWTAVLDIARSRQPATRRCFIHRDYHPGNLLWLRGKLSGVADWVNAANGPPGIDLGHCRVNLVRLYGLRVADRFLAEYASLTGKQAVDYDPYWDAISLLDSKLSPRVGNDLRRLGPPGLTVAKMRSRLDAYAEAIAGRS